MIYSGSRFNARNTAEIVPQLRVAVATVHRHTPRVDQFSASSQPQPPPRAQTRISAFRPRCTAESLFYLYERAAARAPEAMVTGGHIKRHAAARRLPSTRPPLGRLS